MAKSLYHSSTGNQSEHCIHVVGIGRTGAAYVEALLRTGEIEDLLEDPRARFAAMVVDIGEQDMGVVTDYAGGFRKEARVAQNSERALSLPGHFARGSVEGNLFNTTSRMREFLKLEYPRYYWNPNYESWVNRNLPLPKAGDHFPRAVAKAIYAKAYYDEPHSQRRAGQVRRAYRRSSNSVDDTCAFQPRRRDGTGIVVDLARHCRM